MVRLSTAIVALALGAASAFASPLSSDSQEASLAMKRSEAFNNLSPGVRAVSGYIVSRLAFASCPSS